MKQTVMEITFPKPISRHTHLREGDILDITVPLNRFYDYVVAMPNLKDPVDSAKKFRKYQSDILQRKPAFLSILGIMLTKRLTPQIVRECYHAGAKFIKWIPAATSTNSDLGFGLHEMRKAYPIFETAQRLGMLSLNHMELAYAPMGIVIPELKREEEALCFTEKLVKDFPGLKIGIEHISTNLMADFVLKSSPNVIGTVTSHHPKEIYSSVYSRSGRMMRPDLYCMPVLKHKKERLFLQWKIIFDNFKLRFGPDDAPHLWEKKLEGKPGIFCPPEIAIPVLCEIFDSYGAISKIGDFISCNKTDIDFYGVGETQRTITFVREEWKVPEKIHGMKPFMAGQKLQWRIKEEE